MTGKARRQRGEGALFQRASDGLWIGRVNLGYRGGKLLRRQVSGRTQREAMEKLRQARKEIEAGDMSPESIKLDTWLNLWLLEICPAKTRPRTLANYRSYARNYIRPSIGDVKLRQLQARHVRQMHTYMARQGVNSTTQRHAHEILSACLADAVRDGVTVRNVASLVQKPPLDPGGRRRSLSVEEVRRFLAVVEGDRLASRWHTAFLLGLRQGECLGLTWDALDLQAGTLAVSWQLQRVPWRHGCHDRHLCRQMNKPWKCCQRILDTPPGFEVRPLRGNLCLQRPKSKGSERLLPLPEPLRISLASHSVTRGPGQLLVWTTPTGHPIRGEADRLDWHRYLKAAGIPDTDLHSARHTTATLLRALGVDEQTRMEILGHAEADTTRIYTHADTGQHRQALESLGRALEM